MGDEWLYVLYRDGEIYHTSTDHWVLEDLVVIMMFDEDKVRWRIEQFCHAGTFKQSRDKVGV